MKSVDGYLLNLLKGAVALVMVSALLCPPAFAQDAGQVDLPDNDPVEDAGAAEPADVEAMRVAPKRLSDYDLPGLDQKFTFMTKQDLTVVTLLTYLAHLGGLNNVVVSKNITGPANTFKFEDVTYGDALEVILSINNLAYEVKGGIVTVMTDQEYQNLYGVSFYDHKQVKIVHLKYADPARVATVMLAPIKSTIGTIAPDSVTGTIILIDTPEKIREMEAVIETADIPTVSRVLPTETRTFALQYSEVDSIQKEIEALLTKEGGSVRSDKRTKTLIVTDLPHNMKKIEELVRLFDRRSKQVFIEAKIVEITLDDTHSLGINWQHVFDGLDPRFSLQTISQPGAVATPVGYMNFNTIVGGGDLNVVLSALETIGETRLLSNPQIAVVDGKEAQIEVIESQPYKEVALESGTTNVTGVTYIFKDVGVQLSVVPRINDDKFISVDIKPEISSISSWYDGGPQEGTPVIRKAFAETTVMVKDGVTIIIGGLIKDRHDKITSRVPLIGSIPLFGRLFRYDSVNVVNTETVVFMTPRIISGEESFLRLRDIKKKPKPLRPAGTRDIKTFKPIR